MIKLRSGGDIVKEKKENMIAIRVSDTERKKLEEKAKEKGMAVSTYLRFLGLSNK
jgi:predicted DNA binding CopG/RHH family protein